MKHLLIACALGSAGCGAPSALAPSSSLTVPDTAAVATSGTLITEAGRLDRRPPTITILPPPQATPPPAAQPVTPEPPAPEEGPSCPAGTQLTMDANGQPVCAAPPPQDGMSCPAGTHLHLGEIVTCEPD